MRDEIYRQLRAWASATALPMDAKGYLPRPEDNLPWLCADTRAEIEAGDGKEFGAPGERAKIAALHSSSALAVSVFDYWRTRDQGPLAGALDFAGEINALRFEQKFPTGVSVRQSR